MAHQESKSWYLEIIIVWDFLAWGQTFYTPSHSDFVPHHSITSGFTGVRFHAGCVEITKMGTFNEYQWASYSFLALELFKVLLLKSCCCGCLVLYCGFCCPKHFIVFITMAPVQSSLWPHNYLSGLLNCLQSPFLFLQNRIFFNANLIILF